MGQYEACDASLSPDRVDGSYKGSSTKKQSDKRDYMYHATFSKSRFFANILAMRKGSYSF